MCTEGGRHDKEALSGLGTIMIKVVRIQNLQLSPSQMAFLTPELKDEVDEKAKKALCTLSVTYSPLPGRVHLADMEDLAIRF